MGAILQIKRKKVPFFIKKNDYKGMKIEINCTGSDTIQLHELTEFQGELKERSAGDVEKIIKSIKKHGFSFPFFVWKNDGKNNVLDGHGRLMALKQMAAAGEEIPALPCVYISAKNEAEAKEKLLKLNSQYGHMTADSVADFLDGMEIELDDLALPDGVLDLSGIAAPEEETEGDDEAPDVDEDGEPDSQPGEMYELGNSILLCGDSTNPEDVARLMGGEKADMVFTDPPYGYEYQSNKRRKSKKFDVIENDDKILDFFPILKDVNNGFIFVCTTWKVIDKWLPLFSRQYKMSNMVIWDKGGGGIGDLKKTFYTDYEIILVANNGRFIRGRRIGSVWKVKKDGAGVYVHPTQKPVELAAMAIKETTDTEEIVLDLFGGSGSTLIAAEKLGRRARIMELDPKYCDVIRKRWTKWAKENGREVGSGGLE